MNVFNTPLSIQRGVVTVDGKPVLFISADYPYYRDDPANWENRLNLLKDMGVSVVSFYIPWRHHQTDPKQAPDFVGKSQPNRDVLKFIALCQKLNLATIAKPGPFIHAETNYGGLPNWVCPLNNPDIEPLLDAKGDGCYWSGGVLNEAGTGAAGWPLPAPFSPAYLHLTQEWLTIVGEQVIVPNQSPHGPIVAVQIANEGIYSNGQHVPWAYDYSTPALRLYCEFLVQEYGGSLEKFNALNGTEFDSFDEVPAPVDWNSPKTVREMRQYADWGKFQALYMDRVFTEWSAPLKTTLPVIINQNPPHDGPFGLDAWLTRVEPEAWRGVHYGFTNWVGDVSQNSSAFDRYLLTAKRYPGINMEENWGFAELYDPAYVDASTSFYQTLVILNGGTTGFNIYTGVGTGFKDMNLEVIPKAPYPDAAPITADGRFTSKATIARWMADFFENHGEDFLTSRPIQPAAFGVYLPLARVAVWAAEKDSSAPSHGKHLAEFQSQMRALHLDYGILNLETASLQELQSYPFLFMAGGRFMAASVQQRLANYVQQGGRLVCVGSLPSLDEDFKPCEILTQLQASITTVAEIKLNQILAGVERSSINSSGDIWIRSHPQKDVHFVTLLIPANGSSTIRASFKIGNRLHQVELSATPSGGAILRVAEGRLTDFIIKGHNGYLHHSVPPRCVFDGQAFGDDRPGDCIRIGAQTSFLAPEKV